MANDWTTPGKPIKSKMQLDQEFHRTYTSTYQVIAGHEASPIRVAQAGGLPDFGQYYTWYESADFWAFCTGATLDCMTDDIEVGGLRGKKWIITTTHTSRPSTGSTSSNHPRNSPLDDLPTVSGSFVGKTTPVFRDKDGNVIQNSAGQVYMPPAEVDDAHDSLNLSYNFGYINLRQRAETRGKVNSTAMWGLDPRMIKLTQWSYQIQRSGPLEFVKNNFEFLISYDETPSSNVCVGESSKLGWYTVLPNTGEYYYPGGTRTPKNKRKNTDGADQTINTPFNLDCNGDRITNPFASVKWNVFKAEKEYNFLSIPGMPSRLPGPFV